MAQYVFLLSNQGIITLKIVLVFVLVLVGIIPAFAQDLLIPKWFYNVYQYWKEGDITEQEFSGAISYLQKIDALRLAQDSDPIASFVLTDSLIKQSTSDTGFSNCSTDWYITGYFTPVEADYTGKFTDITIDQKQYKFREDFVTEIKTEGWGKTISGNYLGWYDDSFHISDFALDATGKELVVNSIAVDPSIIPTGTRIKIPSLPAPWDGMILSGTDTGTAIIGKHIDVYTGEGKAALDEAYRITGYDNVVCLEVK